MNKIVVFGNQKGGVGKTTLCTLFANYLASLDKKVLVVDADSQQTISEKRKADINKYGDGRFKYQVQDFDISDGKKVEGLMKYLARQDCITLIDAPGNLSLQGLVPLFSKADCIVCPYQYEVTSVNSTVTFIVFVEKLRQHIEDMKTRFIFVPNRVEVSVGKKEEIELWKDTDKAFSEYGTVTKMVKKRAEMQRYNTIGINDGLKKELVPILDQIYKSIINE